MARFLYPVILAGGAGERLWPLSRSANPKPFLRPQGGESLLQQTFRRATALPNVAMMLGVVPQMLQSRAAQELATVNAHHIPLQLIAEPVGRNTAPAVAAAALALQAIAGDDAVMLVLPADHAMADTAAFTHAVAGATELAGEGYLVTFGITPHHAETGYGYIALGEALGRDAFRGAQFIEKPHKARAQAMLASGVHVWNSGMFCFTAGNILRELATHAPELLHAVRAAMPATQSENLPLNDNFAHAEAVSLDVAVMEKTKRLAVVKCELGWSDVGNWQAFAALNPADTDGNRFTGNVVAEATRKSIVHASTRLIATAGVENLVIVDTPDALLVADATRPELMRGLMQKVKAHAPATALSSVMTHRPWGHYTVLDSGENYKLKRLVIHPGGTLSMQLHYHRSEHWTVISGIAQVTNGTQSYLVREQESTTIAAGTQHRLRNPGKFDLIVIEVQTGAYLGEDDIVRFDDAYGRCIVNNAR